LMQETLEVARAICSNAPLSIFQAKKSINIATQIDLYNGAAFEIEAYNLLVGTEDRLEGVRAFNEKRKPNFKGK
jgi:enoyl-CoA hydratase